MIEIIEGFKGKHRFLSNFWPATTPMPGPGGLIYHWKTAEHAYQMEKFLGSSHEKEAFGLLMLSASPAAAKKAGRVYLPREDWESSKLGDMERVVRSKFKNNPDLAELLKSTGRDILIETNWWNDTFWGVCRGRGKNHLGKILMKIRSEL